VTIVAQGSDCAVINTVDIEKYLAGLINREMSPSWPIEAMKAQAVASRSYAYFQMRVNHGKEYDLESTTQDQVYEGASSETAKSNRAAEETRGITLSFGDETIKAYYHANCGGMTELPVAVWGSPSPAFRPVICPYHRRARDRIRWSVSITKEQLSHALKKAAGILPAGFRRLASLEAGASNSSRRLSDVQVSDDRGNNVLVPANYFRNALGNTKVKSTTFQVRKEGNGFRLSGEGYGHGVGMCQVGARAMAEDGKTFRQILAHYYPLAKLKQL
jgi:stage II sporulation protein D